MNITSIDGPSAESVTLARILIAARNVDFHGRSTFTDARYVGILDTVAALHGSTGDDIHKAVEDIADVDSVREKDVAALATRLDFLVERAAA